MNGTLQFFHLIGAVGLFVYGMVLMSESIQRLAGARFRRAVATVTRSPVRAYFTGLSLTGLLQSSSVTSVMVVSFVQVGLLRLSEAYFILLGANLGTTLTSWLVVLTISQPSLGELALPLLALALPMLFAKRRRTKTTAEAIIGFSLMFVGLGLIREGVPPLTEAGLASFLEPFAGGSMLALLGTVVIGVLGTLAFQSSSAMLALVVTLAAGGVVSETMGAAVVLGANIGTTSTAILASLVSGREARRAALSHLLVNAVGVLALLPGLQFALEAIHWFLAPLGAGGTDVAVVLVLLHTGFNLLMTTVFGLFPKPMLWLVRACIPGEGIRGYRTPMVTTSGMDAPELQVLEAQREAERHHELALKMLKEMKAMLEELDPVKRDAIGEHIREYWSLGARYESEVKRFLERLARNKLSGGTYRKVQFLLEWTGDMGQLVGLCERFRQLQVEREQGDVYFIPKQRRRLLGMIEGLSEAMESLGELNGPLEVSATQSALHIGKLESRLIEVEAIREQMRVKHREDIRKGRYSVESGMAFSEMGDVLEEIGLRMGLLSNKFTDIFKA